MMRIKQHDEIIQAEMKVTFAKQSLYVNLYLIDGILVDTGPSSKTNELIPVLKSWDYDQVILTHYHEDHSGLAPWIQKNREVPIFIHEQGIELCTKRANLPFYRKVFWGGRKAFIPKILPERLNGRKYEWEFIHSPGHSPDHIALYNQENGWMFGGDLYVLGKPKSLFAFEDASILMGSIQKVLEYDFETYICSHAGIFKDGKKMLQRKLDYLEEVKGKVELLQKKGSSQREITKTLFPKKHALNYLSMFENSPSYLVRSFFQQNNE
ncbi:MBL fold metallo-hydrolase [Falsibacillus pallidus]|uniref:Glyoxylase-like metal-dependent hydrolase (Beta-lactamase superfamily II) n=1 Tax=Falsibacillus pallidus TaxID=493781 RepID=A0A370GLH7_9BACI|nr:MBL fold metallo-hydrolase [Falsibacillus pallidus]RDI43234.1 glyoxylase-like metal-dependent hydrolase (beta-lactamase superfamily II) [Falsibacillus pallidus]